MLEKLPDPPPGKSGWPWTEQGDPLPETQPNGSPWPKISIVTPSYNQGKFIEETIRSVLLQGYPNLEYIVIDGQSTDQTTQILKKYDPWISHWVSEPDSGQTNAINKGLNHCTGDIFNWINSDDYITKNSLKSISNSFSSELDVLCGYNRRFDNETEGKVEDVRLQLCKTPECSIPYHHFIQPSTYYRLEVAKGLGKLDENLNYNMDKEWFIRYLLRYGQERIAFIDDVLSMFRLHETSKTVSEERAFEREKVGLFRDIYKDLLGRMKYGDNIESDITYINKWKQSGVNLRKTVGALDLYLSYKNKRNNRVTIETLKHLLLSLVRYPELFKIKFGHIIGTILFPTLFNEVNRYLNLNNKRDKI